jgi:photosystem II stability/assembly factor-like uncharacterized protein
MKKKSTLFVILLVAGSVLAEWRSIGPDGGYVQALAIDPEDPSVAYAVSYEYPENARLFVGTGSGANWEPRGRLPQPSVSFLAKDPFEDSLLYSAVRQSFYRSTDLGQNWFEVTLPGPGTDMACDPLVPGRVFMSGYYSYSGSYRPSLYVSTDFGQTWEVSMATTDTMGYAYGIGVDPVDTGTVYLGAIYTQVYKTTDAGASWTRVSTGLPDRVSIQKLSVNADDNNIVLAATSSGMYRTTDAGANWSMVGAMSYAQAAEFSSADPAIAYAVGMSDSVRVMVSTDYGVTWTAPMPGYTATKVAKIIADPGDPNTSWMCTSYGIHRSTDLGANWHNAHTGLNISSVSCISASPEDERRIYLELYQVAVYSSDCGGDTWHQCSYFLSCGNVCGIGIAARSDRDVLYAQEGSG